MLQPCGSCISIQKLSHYQSLHNRTQSILQLFHQKTRIRTLKRRPQSVFSQQNIYQLDDAREFIDHLELISRELQVAIHEENYELATQLRNNKQALMQKLSIPQQQVVELCEELRSTYGCTEKEKLIKNLASTKNELAIPTLAQYLHDENLRSEAESAMWQIWAHHPNTEVDRLMKEGTALLYVKNFEAALKRFEKMTILVPSYAEAHNKKATALYLMKDYATSIEACQLVIELEPYHFGALSGMGLCYLYLGQNEDALKTFKQAIGVNPGLSQISNFISQLSKEVQE
eukprot:TRINITY_DN1994_c1_g1_i1.p1 TRINITY_DN1994_c1_g1~~TRINITY_DN1994_c1_g1_i1.p1  ORF type:complete len:288 (+),score=13.50 TRINITY_DN1994_c1_g1_i1:55-918(+)